MVYYERMADELGPFKIIYISEPRTGLQAVVVVDNISCGPAIGGVRMAPDVTVGEVARLARAMTYKNAAAGLPHGGGKAGIVAPPGLSAPKREGLIRAFGRAIRDLTEYIPGPDMGTDETCMAWLHDEIGRAVGLPQVLGGIPLDIVGATGFGTAICAEATQEFSGIQLEGARVAIQGFGAVGQHAARFLEERGAVIVAVSDSRGAISKPDGLCLFDLLAFKKDGNPVREFPGGQPISAEELVGVDCEIWVPAARPDALTLENVPSLKAKVVIQGANIPATIEADEWLHQQGVLSIPDFIANAGGVICASVEYHGGTKSQAFTVIEEKIKENTRAVLDEVKSAGKSPRVAAEELAMTRLREAQSYRRC